MRRAGQPPFRPGLTAVFCVAATTLPICAAWAQDEPLNWPMLQLELATAHVQQAKQSIRLELKRLKLMGHPTSTADLIPPPLSDKENAAVVYQQAFEALTLNDEDEGELQHFRKSVSANSQAHPADIRRVRRIMEANVEAIDLLSRAAEYRKCQSPVHWEDGFAATFAHLADTRQCTRFIAAKACLDIQDGEPAVAVETICDGLAMCRALDNRPILISELVRYAVFSVLAEPTQLCLQRTKPSADECQRLFEDLGDLEFRETFTAAFRAERAVGLSTLRKMEDMNGDAHRQFPRLPERIADALRAPWGEQARKRYVIINEATYLQIMATRIPLLSRPYHEIHRDIAKIQRPAKKRGTRLNQLVYVLLPTFQRLPVRRDETIAHRNIAMVATALRAHFAETGQYPAALEDIADVLEWAELRRDPFSGEPLKYRRNGDGIILYSIGRNLTDDGGKALAERGQKDDIVWRLPAAPTADGTGADGETKNTGRRR